MSTINNRIETLEGQGLVDAVPPRGPEPAQIRGDATLHQPALKAALGDTHPVLPALSHCDEHWLKILFHTVNHRLLRESFLLPRLIRLSKWFDRDCAIFDFKDF
jgi:hypothetical protein